MPEEHAYLNGELVPLSLALIPVTDRAVMYGDSAFETLRTYSGAPFRLARHMERLESTCGMLRMRLPAEPAEIERGVLALLSKNALTDRDAYVRVTVTGGPSNGPGGLERTGREGLFILARGIEPAGVAPPQEGVELAVSGIRRNPTSPLSGIKSGNTLESLSAFQDARDRGCDDAVMLTTAGNLAEASFSNLFMVKREELLTPDMGCGFLPGITREAVIECALDGGVPVREVTEGLQTLMDSDEAFLTSSIKEITPVRRVGTRELAPCPGPVTRRLRRSFRELVARETGRRQA